MRADASAEASSSCDVPDSDRTSLRTSPAAIGGFEIMQLAGSTVVGMPLSFQPVDAPAGMVTVTRKPWLLCSGTTLYPEPEQPTAAGDGAGDEVDKAGRDVDWRSVSILLIDSVSTGRILLTGAAEVGTTLPEPLTVQPEGRPGREVYDTVAVLVAWVPVQGSLPLEVEVMAGALATTALPPELPLISPPSDLMLSQLPLMSP